MKKIASFVLICACIFMACQNEGNKGENDQKAPQWELATNIHRDGLEFARLGAPLAELDLASMGFKAVGDSLEEAEGYLWLSRTLETENGNLVLEGNFIDDRQFTEEKMQQSLINRIRIETPSFKTAKNISVGMTLGKLLEANEGKEFFVTPIPTEGLVDLEEEEGHIHYLIEADMTVFSVILEQANPISVIPQTNKIRYIVVM